MAKTSAKKSASKAAPKKAASKNAAPKKPAANAAAKAGAAPKAVKKVAFPEKVTAATIASYLAEKHDLTRVQAKEIVESLYEVMEKCAMNGQRIPIGKFGKLYVKVKPATKSRKGRNPATGEEITIPAKRATKVPKFTFSKTFKESAKKAKIPTA